MKNLCDWWDGEKTEKTEKTGLKGFIRRPTAAGLHLNDTNDYSLKNTTMNKLITIIIIIIINT